VTAPALEAIKSKYPYLTTTSSHGRPDKRQPGSRLRITWSWPCPNTEWTSPRKMMDYYMDQSDGIGRLKNGSYPHHVRPHARVSSSERMRDLSAA
jgi:hypothetical protein